MRISSNLFFGLAGWLVASVAAQEKPADGAPKIQFASPEFDFGKVKGGEVIKHSFVFTNTGTATLEILDVKPGCGCTTAGTWEKIIEPGKTGSIPLQLNSSGFGGRITKTATVTCNDPGRSNVILQITGTVWKPIEVTPTMAVFNLPAEGQTNQTKVVKIVSNLDEPLTLTEVESTNTAFKTELRTVQPGKEFELSVTAITPMNAGTMSMPIRIKTSAKQEPELNITAYASVVAPISIIPAQILLPAGAAAATSRPSVTIRNNTTTPVQFTEPTVNLPGATASLRELQSGRVYSLALSLPPEFQLQPGQIAEVTVKSSHPKYPVLRVPLMQSPTVNTRYTPAAPAK